MARYLVELDSALGEGETQLSVKRENLEFGDRTLPQETVAGVAADPVAMPPSNWDPAATDEEGPCQLPAFQCGLPERASALPHEEPPSQNAMTDCQLPDPDLQFSQVAQSEATGATVADAALLHGTAEEPTHGTSVEATSTDIAGAVKSPLAAGAVPTSLKGGTGSAGKDVEDKSGVAGTALFRRNLEKLRERAAAEEEHRPVRSGGCRGQDQRARSRRPPQPGSFAWEQQLKESLRDPVIFVPAKQELEGTRRIVVVDPRAQGVGDGLSDDELPAGPGRIQPRVPAQKPAQKTAEDVLRPPVDKAPPVTVEGNLTLAVSNNAREEDRVTKELSDKKTKLESSKKVMLAKVTKQLQLCLARIQGGGLDEASREKYQDMITKLRAQLGRVSNLP